MEYFDISGWHDAPVKIEVWLDEKLLGTFRLQEWNCDFTWFYR